ncbi:MAG: haloacid dehalogenase [Verrucomicrobia bacterium]|nr:haloacid dehalogenase [Verrucomicrobiota bacterium]|tara:strand:- start:292 stop:918 length:627 start_codon:yes stop_codon:yes gene_type:complete
MKSSILKDIKNIIFDLGNVIINLDIEASNKAFTQLLGPQKQKFFDQLQSIGVFQDFEKGTIDENEFVQFIQNLNKKAISSASIVQAWNSMLLNIPENRFGLLKEIKRSYRTFCLSNTNQLHADFIHEDLKKNKGLNRLDSLFEKVYLSHEIGMRKPDLEIFQFVLNQHDLKPAETLFIDDTEGHLKGAAKLGIKTLHIKGNDKIENYF